MALKISSFSVVRADPSQGTELESGAKHRSGILFSRARQSQSPYSTATIKSYSVEYMVTLHLTQGTRYSVSSAEVDMSLGF